MRQKEVHKYSWKTALINLLIPKQDELLCKVDAIGLQLEPYQKALKIYTREYDTCCGPKIPVVKNIWKWPLSPSVIMSDGTNCFLRWNLLF